VSVRTIELDFLRPTGRGSRVGPWLLIAGTLAAVAAISYQGHLKRETAAREDRLATLHAIASRSLPAITARGADTPELREQIKKANAVLQLMNVPWGELFAAIESAETADVALLAVQPDARNRSVLIGGDARTLSAIFAYMERLERSKRLHGVVLQSHEVKSKDPGQPVAFTLSAAWQEEQ